MSTDPNVRVQLFLKAIQAVWMGRACLTHEGTMYLGVPYLRTVPRSVDELPESEGEAA